MTDEIPVNPEILRWARESLHMEVEDVATRLKKTPAEIESWEAGENSPTYVQLETLAYQVYKRPLAIFFFPDPPEEEEVRQSFRTLPDTQIEQIPPRIRYLIRKAKVLQINLQELYGGEWPASYSIVKELELRPTISAIEMAESIRTYLGVTLATQKTWQSPETALDCWRSSLEEAGIFVFKDSFKRTGPRGSEGPEAEYSGFCIYDDRYPLIYVNNNKPKTRQIFTLFHELAHLIMRTGGVDYQDDTYIENLTGNDRRIEVLSNAFAGEFLVPSGDIVNVTSGSYDIDDEYISTIATLYSVSREVVLRRFLDLGMVPQWRYEEKAEMWRKESSASSGGGGNHYFTKGAYLGEKYVDLVFSRYHKGDISLQETAEYLGEKLKNVRGMEDWLLRVGGIR